HGHAQERAAGSLRSLDRRAHLAYPRRHRRRSEKAAPRHHGARRRLCVRQGAGLGAIAMRRLYQKIYLTIVASLVLVVLVAGAAWRFGSEFSPARQAFEVVGAVAAAVLPPASAPRQVQAQAIAHIAEQLGTDIALYDGSIELIGSAGQPLPRPLRTRPGRGWVYGPGGPAWSIPLPDGRWLVARAPGRHLPSVFHLIAFLG